MPQTNTFGYYSTFAAILQVLFCPKVASPTPCPLPVGRGCSFMRGLRPHASLTACLRRGCPVPVGRGAFIRGFARPHAPLTACLRRGCPVLAGRGWFMRGIAPRDPLLCGWVLPKKKSGAGGRRVNCVFTAAGGAKRSRNSTNYQITSTTLSLPLPRKGSSEGV